MNIPIDDETRRKLEMLSDRWGISVPTLAECALFLGVDYWLADLQQPSAEQIEKILNNPIATGCSCPGDDTSPTRALIPSRRRRDQ